MKKHIYLLSLLITSSINLLAQVPPPPPPPPPATCPTVSLPFPPGAYSNSMICNTYSGMVATNPTQPINCLPQGRKNIYFNWFSQSTEKINTACKPNSIVSNPTYQGNNTTVLPLVNINEFMSPADGWELLDRNFGLDDADLNITNASIQSNDLYFCLYNKRLGNIRFFYAIADLYCEPTLFNGSEIILSIATGNTSSGAQSIAPSILDLAGKLKPLDMMYEANYTFDRLEGLLRSSYNWFYADFPVVYDPCVCLYSSKLKFEVKTVSNASITLSGSINGNIVQQLPGGGGISNLGEANNKYSLGNLNKAGQKVLKAYNDNKGFQKTTFDQIDAIYNNDLIRKNDCKNNLSSFITNLKSNSFVKGALNAVPFGMAALSVFDFFTSGGNANKAATIPQEPMKFSLDASIKLSGNSITTVNRRSILMHVPGSNLAAQNADPATRQCFYNAPLGVFNLINTPVFTKKIVPLYDYSFETTCTDAGGGVYGPYWFVNQAENVRYLLKMPLKYVLNPYSDLVLEDAQIALIFEEDSANYNAVKGLFTNNSTIPGGLIPEGKNANNKKYKFRTEYTNTKCLNKLGISILNEDFEDPCNSYIPAIHSYEMNNPIAIKLLCTFKNRTNPNNSQNVLYLATYPIKVEDDNSNSPMPANCDANYFIPASKTDLTAFCNSSIYTDNRALKVATLDSLGIDSSKTNTNHSTSKYNYFFSLTPNPASGNTLLTIENFEQERADIFITDIYGKTIVNIAKGQIFEIGKTEIDINLSGLQRGIYIIHVKSNELHQKAKLIVE